MSDLIKLLPDHVANQIAAGEVIQRPASVVKELLENAIDAGSTDIKLIIRDGGKTLIQVIDNGRGMSPTDARMCWERHATSKIGSAEDIFSIRTMGFRGEALASIASIAMVELKTKRAEDAVGTLIRIEASEVMEQEPTAMPDGTSITVKNLFYNVPARRNFLKSDPGETRYIIDEFARIALANPSVAMSMYHNDKETYILRSAELASRIEEMFKHKTPKHILPLDEQTTIVNISGYLGKPEFAKKTRGEQFFFVNRRFIKDAYLNHALVSCFENLIAKEQFPFYVVHIDIDPGQIDVNVHPTKTEIKFEDERAVYQIIKAVCKKALGQHYQVPSIQSTMLPDLAEGRSTQLSPQEFTRDSSGPAYSGSQLNSPAGKKDWQQLFDVLQKPETIGDIRPADIKREAGQEEITFAEREKTPARHFIQIHNSLIISQTRTGILLIDQQAAHERVLYEKYLDAFEHTHIVSQRKLLPKTIRVHASDEKLLTELHQELQVLGFEINALGKNTFAINGVPAELDSQNEQELILSLLEQYKQQAYADFNKHERVARSVAKRAAINAGTSLSQEEMAALADQLFACREPQYAPGGKTCIKAITLEELYAMF